MPIDDGDLLAAVDLGSNSFHLLQGDVRHGVLRPLRRERDSVRLAAGLRPDGTLAAGKRREALDCLRRLRRHLAGLPADRVRVVATNTFRRMREREDFQAAAERALGYRIEVVDGDEEARLIWLGVRQGMADTGQPRLLIDIGGGSTEFIIDPGQPSPVPGQPGPGLVSHSRQMGSVATTMAWFPDGRISADNYLAGIGQTVTTLTPMAAQFRQLGWQQAVGSSGTVRAIGKIGSATGWSNGEITPELLARIRRALLKAGQIRAIDLPGLSKHRSAVIAGGLVVLEAAFQTLGLTRMSVCPTAMREGILMDLYLQRQSLRQRATTAAHGAD
ncbi:MAG: hypothetical protein M0Q42_02310 [Xanthomonadales bacterium]|nr:hypothetical protein [Xanthomonadales bacterium]